MFTITGFCPDTNARTGILETSHGDVMLPCFMPVATKGSVKTLSSIDLEDLEVTNLIANAYLLSLRPGLEMFGRVGGLHSFMDWSRTIFTDSGGFQIIRERFVPEVTDRGVFLRSPFDGKRELFTPQRCCLVQETLGSDVAMVLDDCAPFGSDDARVNSSVERTTCWAEEFLSLHTRKDQMVFLITQGAVDVDQRIKSARELAAMDCQGYGIGGLCIGESKEIMHQMVDVQLPLLPPHSPKYLMGVGSPEDIIIMVEKGVDIFDSVYPTRAARHRTALTKGGRVNVNATGFQTALGPVEAGCSCSTCSHYSRAYLFHLFKVKELLAMRLLTIHNVHFMMQFMVDIRRALQQNNFADFRDQFLSRYL